MDFAQRSQHPSPAPASAPSPAPAGRRKKLGHGITWIKWSSILLLFCVTILILALISSLIFGTPTRESKYVNSSQYQAVFLNNGQVYFGHIKSLNDKYTRIDNIYYLRQNTTAAANQTAATSTDSGNFSLVKLGCEIHGPADEMLVNHDQVTFWENLKSDGQVAKAIDAYIKQNPNGQKCDATTTSTPSTKTPTATTPAPTTTTPAKQ